MSFHTKTFPAQDRLVTALKASTALTKWEVDYGIPARREDRHVWVDEQVENWTQGLPTTGVAGKQEEFELHVYVYRRATDSTALELREDIVVAADAIADAVASDVFLGGVVLLANISGAEYDSAFADPEGRAREGVLRLTITCKSYLG